MKAKQLISVKKNQRCPYYHYSFFIVEGNGPSFKRFWCQVDLGEDNSLSSLLRYNPPLEQTGVTLDKINFC